MLLVAALRLAQNFADIGEMRRLARGNTACGYGAGQGAECMAGLGRCGRARGKRSDFAKEIVLAGRARSKRAVGVAQAVAGGMRGHFAAAYFGKSKAAEGRIGIAGAFAGHGDSIS